MEKTDGAKVDYRKRKHLQLNVSIKLQLLIAFLIPIAFVIMVGVISYQKAAQGMIQNYEEATLSTIDMGMQYLDFGCKLVSSDAMQLSLDSEVSSYAFGTFQNDRIKRGEVFNKTKTSVSVKAASDQFVESITIVPKSTAGLISSGSASGDGFYEEWEQTEEAKQVLSGTDRMKWISTHPALDDRLGTNPESYALSFMAVFPNKSGVVAIDINKKAIVESMEKLNLGMGSIAAYVMEDGRQLISIEAAEEKAGAEAAENISNTVFADLDCYNNSYQSESPKGSQYIKLGGRDFLFLFSKSKVTGSMLCALIPKESVVRSADSIKEMSFWLVILACIIAAVVGSSIAYNITHHINYINKKLTIVSNGDLTVKLRTKGRHEFALLSKQIMEVITSTGKLIEKVESSVDSASGSANDVGTVSERITEYSKNITEEIGDMEKGISEQAEYAENCSGLMEELAQTIQLISENVEEIGNYADNTKEMIAQGIQTMGELSKQSVSTTEITGRVKKDITDLEEESSKISKFIDVINDISSQTNLLSLNASIEAARAGEAGRGFAVVAEEIRKLADGSLQAAKEIRHVVENIQTQTKGTVTSAENAEQIVGAQAGTVKNTIKVFENMNHCIEQLLDQLRQIGINVQNAAEGKEGTMNAVGIIATISHENAQSASVVNDTAKEQMEIVGSLKVAAEKLNENMSELQTAMGQFKIR